LLDAVRLSAFLKEHQITTMWLTSPLFNQLAQENAEMFSSLHHLIIGGDVLVPRYVNVVRKVCPEISLWNGYGPTENTTFSTCFLIKKDFSEQIPIGKPISNSTAYILNSNHHLQPIGIPGELYVGGDGVARGYFHRPLLTSEKFMTSPFATGERMYRTGDLARWLPDGTIEFLGRIDHQVKIRGFRIELGEVESQLLAVDNVFDAVVTTRQNESGQSLCAYFTGPSKLSSSELRMKLSRSLPAYMIPAYFVHLDSIPLTKNGKVDRKALPEPDGTFERELAYKKPRNEREELLCLVWQEVLGTKQIGISDNFFSRGGDSIKAIQISARLHKYGWKLDMKNLFQNPTIELVSCYLEQIHGGQAEQSPVEGIVPLTPIQKWFFTKQFTDMHHWNQAVMLHAPSGFDPHFVERTLQKMVRHHDALRMEFSIEDGQFVQFNSGLDAVLPELDIIRPDVADNELEKAILLETNRIQGSINLSKGPLLKAALFQTSQGDHLLIVIHHLVVDGVSWRILIEDFAAGYHQAEKGEEIILPEKTHSYQKWAEKLQEYANSKTFLKEIDYWSLAENGNIPSLPRDIHESNSRMRHVDSIDFSLSSMETVLLTTQVHEAYHTEINDILLTALGYAIQEWTGQKQVLVNLEGHGREEVIEELNVSRTVGWFTTQYPVVLDMQNSSDIDYQIKRVKEDLRHIPNKGIGYGLLRYLTDEEHKTDLLFPLAPEIGFNYLGEFKEQDGNGLFKRSALSIGNSLSPETEKMHPIDISGAIEGDVLKMTIFYSSLDFEKQTIRQLGETFKRKLILLMEHCLNQSESILTPSDMGDDELTLEELEKLMEIL
jgi:non-ribosomal peptide synthase protein (TIGR01720 family)